MQPWKRLYQAEWMSSDIKPKGEYKKLIQRRTRAQLKVDVKKKVREAQE